MTLGSRKRSPWFPKPYAHFVQRLRVASGFLLLLTFAVFCDPSVASLVEGLPVCLIGLWLRGWAAGHLAKDAELATGGPYAYIRNPLYAGTLLIAGGIILASRSIALAIIGAAVFLLVYLPVIELEEQHLSEIFPAYETYAMSVNRLLPVRKWSGRARSFSWFLYRKNREDKAALGFAVALAWMLGKCWWNLHAR